MSSREVLRKQNDVVISKSSELILPQLLLCFAMTIKKTFSAILVFNLFYKKSRIYYIPYMIAHGFVAVNFGVLEFSFK